MKADVKTLDNATAGEIELDDGIFGLAPRPDPLHRVVTWQLNKRRAGTHSTKTPHFVSGSGKKIYKQKGTGRARHGSIRAPIFVGGGRAHPPKPQDWSYRPPRRVRVAALKGALSLILKEGRLTVVDSIDLGEVKTKKLAGVLVTLQAGKKTLVVDDGGNQNLRLSIRNLEDKLFLPPEGVNVYDLLRHDHLVLSKGAIKALEARCIDKADSAEAKQ